MVRAKKKSEKKYFQRIVGSVTMIATLIFAVSLCCTRAIYAESYVYNNNDRYQSKTYEAVININEEIVKIEEKYPVKIVFYNSDQNLQTTFILSLRDALDWYGENIINKIASFDEDNTLEFILQTNTENHAFINLSGQYGAYISQPSPRVFIHEIYHLIDSVTGFPLPDIFSQEIYLNEYCSTSPQEDKAVSYEYYFLVQNDEAVEPQNEVLKEKIEKAAAIVEMLQSQ